MTISDERTGGERIVVYPDPDVADLIPAYLEHRRSDVKAIRQALELGEHEKIRSLGHNMKGTGSGYGLDGITEIGRALESAAREADPAAVGRALEELIYYLEKLEVI